MNEFELDSVAELKSMIAREEGSIEASRQRLEDMKISLSGKIVIERSKGLLCKYAYTSITQEERNSIKLPSRSRYTIFGVNCSEAFSIHSFEYTEGLGRSEPDRVKIDARLHSNLLILIEDSFWPIKWLRRAEIDSIYKAVRKLGSYNYIVRRAFYG